MIGNRFAKALGVRARPRVAFWSGALIESDAKTHRTPKHFVRNPCEALSQLITDHWSVLVATLAARRSR